jgi:hypothetical protein
MELKSEARILQPTAEYIKPEQLRVGDTYFACVKGCALKWVERGINPEADTASTFSFSCSGRLRCSSGKFGGWVTH